MHARVARFEGGDPEAMRRSAAESNTRAMAGPPTAFGPVTSAPVFALDSTGTRSPSNRTPPCVGTRADALDHAALQLGAKAERKGACARGDGLGSNERSWRSEHCMTSPRRRGAR